jgi:RHS repeat-associated protein
VCEVPEVEAGCDDEEAVAYVSDMAYDDLGRRTQVAMPPGARSYQYSATTQRVVEDRFDAGAASGYWIQRDYGLAHTGRDPIGNLIDVQGGTSEAGNPVVAATYSYDRRNRLASWERDSVTEHYSFDTLGNLVGYATASEATTNQEFGESGAGPHAVTTSTATGVELAYAYDGDGNIASALGGASPRHYSFDWASRLVKVGSTPGTGGIITVGYDAGGMRVRDFRPGEGQRIYVGDHATFHRDDVLSSTFESAEFHIFAFGEAIAYKRVEPVALRGEASVAGIPLRLPEPLLPFAVGLLVASSAGGLLVLGLRLRLHEPIARHPALAGSAWTLALLLAIPPLPARSGGGGPGVMRRWLVTDHLGSGSVWLDEDGMRVRHTEYAPFGKLSAQVIAGDNVSPWYYAGHRREFWSGLDYMRARWYSPATGTFVGVDPVIGNVLDPQSHNAYSYALNNPVRLVDPTGTTATEVFIGIVTTILQAINHMMTARTEMSLKGLRPMPGGPPEGVSWMAYQDGTLISVVADSFWAGQAHVVWAELSGLGFGGGYQTSERPQGMQQGLAVGSGQAELMPMGPKGEVELAQLGDPLKGPLIDPRTGKPLSMEDLKRRERAEDHAKVRRLNALLVEKRVLDFLVGGDPVNVPGNPKGTPPWARGTKGSLTAVQVFLKARLEAVNSEIGRLRGDLGIKE